MSSAKNRTPGWNIYDTDKEAGIISAWNDTYESLTDADRRQATFFIKRLGREKTSVQLTEDCQSVVGVGDLLREIDIVMGKHKEKTGVMSEPFH